MIKRIMFVAMLVWAASSQLELRADPGPFSIGARAVSFIPDGDGGSTSWSGGIQARLRLPLFFAVEASVDYREMEMGNHEISDWPVQLSALIYVLPKIVVVQPFLLVGGGWYNSTIEGPGDTEHTDSRFGPHVGAGLDWSFSGNWFIDTTYRYVWLDEFDSLDVSSPEEFQDDGHMVTVGLNYRF